MNSHICICAWARDLKRATLLFWVLAVSVILTVFIHFLPSVGTTDTTTATRYEPDAVINPNSVFRKSTENTTNIETYFNIPKRDDEIQVEGSENTSCSNAVDSAASRGQVSNVPSDENAPLPMPLPDGRIFMRGEPPYGYLPTCGPKDKGMPFVPVEPD
jgi:hypothetical protein